jgi:2-hydroxychromene-2-carboxylate isomerase
MGDVIYLHERLANRDRRQPGEAAGARVFDGSISVTPDPDPGPTEARYAGQPSLWAPHSVAFFFDLSSPLSYLAAERVERMLGDVTWVPTVPLSRGRGADAGGDAALLDLASREAVAHRLPLVVPERYPCDSPSATRAAAFAAANGAGAKFALAAFRLAFCGGFDLNAPHALAEAAAAAGVAVRDLLRAAEDPRWEIQPAGATRGLLGHGIASVPAIRVANRWFEGIDAVDAASVFTTLRVVRDAAGVYL